MHADDGVRLRIAHWPNPEARATILLFPGRTEYCEKYGRAVRDLIAAGYTIVGIDWRGQGFSDRVTKDARLGHVETFADYQRDVAAFVAAVDEMHLPEPRYLLAHSMGGCIGLRAMINGLEIERAVFSAPMWGIYVAPVMAPMAKVLPGIAARLGLGLKTVPGTRPNSYIGDTPFLINLLTTDRDYYDYMARQVQARDEFALGGPTVHWFTRARVEMRSLRAAPRPDVPTATFVGTKELVVDPEAIREMHDDWPSGQLHVIEGGKHEMMMEAPEIRAAFMAGTLSFLETGEVVAPQISI